MIIRAPYITIAGQTVPGDGVCIAGESVWIDMHDVIIRFMRFRRGATDVLRRDDALGGNGVGNIIIDHVFTSWGLDENMSMYRHVYDRQGDGIPDAWEKAHGLNPNNATDASLIAKNGGGYSNIEVYLNSVVEVGQVKPAK